MHISFPSLDELEDTEIIPRGMVEMYLQVKLPRLIRMINENDVNMTNFSSTFFFFQLFFGIVSGNKKK